MSECDSLESNLKKARVLGAYESHHVSSTRVASRGLGSAVKMPWEVASAFLDMPALPSPFAKGGCIVTMPVGPAGPAGPVKSSSGKLESLRLAGVRVPSVPGQSRDQKLSEAREAALAKWLGILERFPEDFGLTLSIQLDKENGRNADLKSSLQDVFSQKASVTISGRAGPLARYVKHCRGRQVKPFPVTEAGVYAFLQDYASHEAPTFARSFLSSLAFAKFTVSLKVSDEIFIPRVRGLSSKLYLEKRKTRQKPALKVDHVRKLEAIASGSIALEPPDRVASGFFVWTLYARARYSDAQAAGAMTCDLSDTPDGTVGYLEAAVERSKTSFSLESAHVRSHQRNRRGALGCQSAFWRRVANVAVGGGECHEMDEGTFDPCRLRQVRAALGYHARGRDGTELIYGRDNMSAPVRQPQGVLLEVSSERFRPDATRSGYFVKRFEDPEGVPIPPDEVLSDSSSEASEDAEDVDHEAAEAATDVLGRQWEPDAGLRAELEAATSSDVAGTSRPGLLARFLLLKMANYSESQSVLQSRLSIVGFAEGDVQKILPEVGNLRRLAFISSFTPGQTDEEPLVHVLKDILKRELTIADMANWRAVYNEAYAVVTAEMKQRIEKADPESTVRPLSRPERSEQYERQAKKLVGISLKGPLEPADALVDLAVASYEANELRYIPWDRCVSKEAELAGEKKRDVRFTVEANLIDFSVADQWTQRLMKARMQSPAEHFARPTWKQLESADRQLFAELRDKTRAGVQTVASGRPLDSLLPDTMYMNEVACLLQPFPVPSLKDTPQKPGAPKWERPSPSSKGGGKGKKGKQRFATKLPAGLEGCRSHTNRGDPICFAFNLGGCSTKGQKCEKGLHICAVPKCGAHNHGAAQCLREGVHRPNSACTGGSPPSGVDCRPNPGVDREDHHEHNVGSYSAIARPPPSLVEAARSRSPRHRDGAGPQSGKASSSLDEGHVSAADVLRVFDSLPSDALKRGASAPLPASKSYATGDGGAIFVEHEDGVIGTTPRNILISSGSAMLMFRHARPKEPVSDPGSPLKPGSALYVEIKCGSGLLAARVRRDGFQVMALEHSRPAERVHTHLVPVDIETDSGFSFAQTVIGQDAPFHVHFFPATKDCFKATFDAVQTVRLAKLLLASDSHWSVLHPLASALWCQLDLPDTACPYQCVAVATGSMLRARLHQIPCTHQNSVMYSLASCSWRSARLASYLNTLFRCNARVILQSLPPGSRLLRILCDRGVVGAKQVGSLSGVPSSVTFGIYRTEHEFVAQALHIDHPFDLCVAVPDFTLRALAFTLKEGPVGVMKHRLNLPQQWTSWKRDLSSAEAELRAAMDPGVASVMKGKNILLLENIASTFGWPDTEIFEHLKHGFPLVGESSPSGIFDVDRKPALMTRAELVQHAKFLRPALWAKVSSAEVDDLAREVWDSTHQEMLVKEWLTGPYSWDELQARHPEGWLPVRRFGIVQKAKTRSIDDLAENLVNQASRPELFAASRGGRRA
ncbi:unnamed protein product [Symbiodinium sp. CCMP2592]|nr:unnamed protein product [Symbiodinium sp. CCMP2592]